MTGPLRRAPRAAGAAVALILTAVLAGGCGAATTLPDSAATRRVEGGTITYAHYQEPPCLWGGWVQQAYLSRQVFDSLVSYDNGEIRPWLATSWKQSADDKAVTFTLRRDIRFTDGTPFDAQAVVANVDYWLENLGWVDYSFLTGAEAVDEHTVVLHTSEPNPEIFNELANGHFGIQSPTALREHSAEQNCLAPVGTGPWIVEQWKRGEGIHFVRNDDYNSAPANARHQGPAYAERLDWKFVPDATTRWGSLLTGQADAVYDIPSSQWQAANRDYQVLNYVATGRPQALTFNTAQGPFTDRRVRQAFTHAIDRTKIAAAVFKGSVPFEGNGSLSKTTPGYLAVDDTLPYDPAAADRLLDAAGWTQRDSEGYRMRDGKVLRARLPYGLGSIITPDGSTAVQIIQDQVRRVGIELDLIPLTPTQQFGGAYAKQHEKEISFGYWVWPSPSIMYITYKAGTADAPNGNNTAFFDNPEVEAKILDAQREPDPAERTRKYADLQTWFQNEAVAVGLYNYTYNLTVADNLKDVWQDSGNGLPVFSDAYFVEPS
ncbi:ABC transporter substrate-binding protein [Nocardia sp. NPDC058499]|uniref:ABC transporter substrate-binding protein n=1 Tax=Nocardia sp. NPDC058499 TaxID=3346530 RepID=UPI00365AE0E1